MKTQATVTPVEILLVEDSPTDVCLAPQALSGGKLLAVAGIHAFWFAPGTLPPAQESKP